MTIPWDILEKRTAGLISIEHLPEPGKPRWARYIHSGLRLRLSEVKPPIIRDPTSTLLSIWVDTLVIDQSYFDGRGVTIVARNIETESDGVGILRPDPGKTHVNQFLVQQIADNKKLTVTVEGSTTPGSLIETTGPSNKLNVTTLVVNDKGVMKSRNGDTPEEIRDLVCRGWALNSLKASYLAAAILMYYPEPEAKDTARSMLRWVVNCTKAAVGAAVMRAEYTELLAQATSLLIPLGTESGTRFVPVLSTSFYKAQVFGLIDSAGSYQGMVRELSQKGDLKNVLAKVAETMAKVAGDQVVPVTMEMKTVKSDRKRLAENITALLAHFHLQTDIMHGALDTLEIEATNAAITKLLKLTFECVVATAKTAATGGGMIAGSKDAKMGDLLKSIGELAVAGKGIYSTATKKFPGSSLPDQLKNLIETQTRLMTSLYSATVLDATPEDAASAAEALPAHLDVVTLDPELAWDNFLSAVQAEAEKLERTLGDATKAKNAASDFIMTLRVLANYGKAINANYIELTRHMAREVQLREELKAAQTMAARWRNLDTDTKSEREKLAVAVGMLGTRLDAINRSLFVAWTNYANAFFYLNFSDPERTWAPDMDIAEMKECFTAIAEWTSRAVESGGALVIPSENVVIELTIPVAKRNVVGKNGITAVIVPATKTTSAGIVVDVPLGAPELAGQLPKSGNVSVWIDSAEFYLNGAKPNSSGRVIFDVSTSGLYVNGFYATKKKYSFLSKIMTSPFGYESKSKKTVIPWKVKGDIFMQPSLYTGWLLSFDENGGDVSDVSHVRVTFIAKLRQEKGF